MADDGIDRGAGTVSDDSLAAAAAAGDRAALEALLGRHQGWVHNLALRMLWDAHDAEDATQEILVKIATRLASFRGESAVRTWVWRVAANRLLSRRRGRVEGVVHDLLLRERVRVAAGRRRAGTGGAASRPRGEGRVHDGDAPLPRPGATPRVRAR